MPRRPKRKIEDAPEGSYPPMDDAPIAKHPSPEAPKRADDGGMLPFDLDAELGNTPAPGAREKKAPAESAPPEKPLTVEEKKKAVEAEKKEKSRQAFLRAHPQVSAGAGLIARGAFATGAIIQKEPLWNLTDKEEAAIAKAWQPVIEIYGPEWLLKLFPVLGAVITTGQILASKGQQIGEKKEREKTAKANKMIEDMAKATADLNAARQQLEAQANARQVPATPKPEPKPKGA